MIPNTEFYAYSNLPIKCGSRIKTFFKYKVLNILLPYIFIRKLLKDIFPQNKRKILKGPKEVQKAGNLSQDRSEENRKDECEGKAQDDMYLCNRLRIINPHFSRSEGSGRHS